MNRLPKLFAILLCLILIMIIAPDAVAKKKKKKPIKMDDRVLKNHQFLRPYLFPMAMPTTNVGVSLGYAWFQWEWDNKIDMYFFNEDTFNQGGLNETIDFEIEFLDRFSIEVLMEGRAFVGADESAALLYGGDASYYLSAIPKVMVYQNDKWGSCFSVTTDLVYDQGVQTSPVVLMVRILEKTVDWVEDFAEDLTDGSIQTEDDMEEAFEDGFDKITSLNIANATVTRQNFSIRPSILYAQTIHPVFGIQLGLRYDWGIKETIDGPELLDLEAGDPPTAIKIGGVGTFDLNPISRAHVGFKMEADYEIENDDGDTANTLTLGGGVMYTGRKNLELGATFFRETSDWEDVQYTAYFMLLNMRYFF